MSDVCKYHDQAMVIMDMALQLQTANDSNAYAKFLEACELEAKAAYLVEKKPENEPSRGMLFLGAASLAWQGKDYALAERLAADGLSGYPTPSVREDLWQLIDDIKFSIIAETSSLTLTDAEAEMRFNGGTVGYGTIDAKQLISRLSAFERLLERTTRKRYNIPFEKKMKEIKSKPTYYAQVEYAKAGSFGMKIRLVQKSGEQLSLLQQNPQEIINDVIKNIELMSNGDLEGVRNSIADEEYYRHFVAHAKELLPDGNTIEKVGFITNKSTVPVTFTKKELKKAIAPQPASEEEKPKKRSRQKSFIFQGDLKISDALADRVALRMDDDSIIKIYVPDGLDEIVKTHFNTKVEATCEKRQGKYYLIDIDPLS